MSLNIPKDKDKLIALVDRRHPAYKSRIDHWKFCRSTYDGGRDWFKTNIFRYIKEGDTEYKDRIERAYRFNHTREVVNLTTKYIFKSEIIRNTEDATKAVRRFWKSSTLNGISIDALMRRVSDLTSIYGRCWVLVDTTKTDVNVSREEENKSPARIYAYTVTPEDMLDYSWDDEGELNWVMYRIYHRDDSDPVTSTGATTVRYMIWTKTNWAILEEKEQKTGVAGRPERVVSLVSEGDNIPGIVPAFSVDERDSDDPYDVPAMIADIAYLDRAIANYLSNIDAIVQDQTFSQLIMPANAADPGDDANKKLVEMGTKRIFTYNPEATKAPEYISPDPSQAGMIKDMINKIINEIYNTVGLAGERTKEDNSVGIDNSSGVAKAYDFERVNSLLAHKAAVLDKAENKLIYLVEKFSGEELKKDKDGDPIDLVKYPDNFDVRSLYDEFEIAEKLQLVEAPEEVRRLQMNALVTKMLPRASAAEKAAMEKDIKKWPPKIEMELPGGTGTQTAKTSTTRARKSNRQGQVTAATE